MTNTWHFETGDGVSRDAYVQNLPENTNDVYFDLFLAGQETESIYQSPVIPRGSELTEIALDKPLEAGTYDCVLIYHLVDEEQKTISTLRVAVVIVVEESDGTKKYAYQEKEDASTWKAMNINRSGKVSQLDVEADTTAPTVDVTWSWEKAADAATADTDVVEYKVGPQIRMDNNGLITMTDFTSTQNYASLSVTDGEGTKWDISDSPFTWDLTNYDAATGGDANIQLSEQWKNFLIEKGGNVTLELTLSDGSVRTFTTTLS